MGFDIMIRDLKCVLQFIRRDGQKGNIEVCSKQQSLMIATIWLLLLSVGSAVTTAPFFVTTIAGTYEAGALVLLNTNPTTASSFSSLSTSLTFANTYGSTPSVGIGFQFINSNFPTTLVATETIIDISISAVTTGSATFLLNYTQNTVSQIAVNYVVVSSSFFLDVRSVLLDLTSDIVFTVSNTSVRTATKSVTYKTKSNSSNSVVTYMTAGLSMIRLNSATFEYNTAIGTFQSSTFTLAISVQGNNRMRFLRITVYNYEGVVTLISPPNYLDMGFFSLLGGSIPDGSGLGFAVTGTVVTGAADWAITDANSLLNYNMQTNGLTYSLSSNAVSRLNTGFVWYRVVSCPPLTYITANTCVSCDYTCLTCSAATNTACLTCGSTRQLSVGSCPCVNGYIDVTVALCEQLTCSPTCLTCSNINVCGSCQTSIGRYLSNGQCLCQAYNIDPFATLGVIFCLPCYAGCVTCSSAIINGVCLSCNLTKDHRVLQTNATCTCVDGYYDVVPVVAVCASCQYSCGTCTNGSQCVACNAAFSRTYNATSKLCSCLGGYYDDLLFQACKLCPYTCATCSSASVCLTCPSSRTFSSGACICSTGFYDDGVSQLCQPCYFTCFTCSTSPTCSQCSTSLFRTMSSGQCLCQPGYYNAGIQQCSLCSSACSTCASAATCLTCNSNNNRVMSLANTCVCIPNYYEAVPSTAVCPQCQYVCLTCSAFSTCTACNATNHRTLASSSCPCDATYYDGGVAMCLSCMHQCRTCTTQYLCTTCDSTRDSTNLALCNCLPTWYDDGISNVCLSCLPTCATCTNANQCTTCPTLRTITSQATCVCLSKTYEPSCLPCLYSCASCLTTSVTCTACNATAFRYLDATNCLCFQSYYSDGVNELCQPCHYSCLTCITQSACSSCPSNRVLNGSYCSCTSALYENSVTLNCLSCLYTCSQCSEYSVCTQCSAANFRSLSGSNCICQGGYYDNGVNQLCYACQGTCLTCSAFSVCTSCSAANNRYISASACPCLNGYYEASGSCLPCHYSCSTCSSGSTCVTCRTGRTLALGLCRCNDGTYDSNQVCQPCTAPCLTCTTSSTACTACPTGRTLSSNACICLQGTYDTGSVCANCLPTCTSCSTANQCTSCLAGSGRTLDAANLCVCPAKFSDQNGASLTCVACHYSCTTCLTSTACATCTPLRVAQVSSTCVCPVQHYFDDGINPTCIPCLYSCLQCSTTAANCIACNAADNRAITNAQCLCNALFYDDGTNALCQPCQYTCKTCASATTCSTCDTTFHRTYTVGPFCACAGGYYDDGVNQGCVACSYACASCQSTATTCLSCISTRTLTANVCPCNTGLYDNAVPVCATCLFSCLTCINGADCLSCPSTRSKSPTNQCVCQTGYYEANTQQCALCHPSCVSCTAYQVCTLCDAVTNGRVLLGSNCVCPNGAYSSAPTSYVCQQCSYSCATCISTTQCTSCTPSSLRFYDVNTKLCGCQDGYYDGGLPQCLPCPFDCLTCSSATVCLTCESQRTLVSSRCTCISSTYTNGTVCVACPTICTACTDASHCTACIPGLTLLNNVCLCTALTFLPSLASTACAACAYSCATCVSAVQCTSCDSTKQRYPFGLLCGCLNKFYDDGSNQQCASCQYSCELCGTGSSCLTCDSSLMRVYDIATTLCSCVGGYFESAQLCIQCKYTCVSCSSATTCNTCNPSYYRTLTNNQCLCPTLGYFDDGSNPVCQSCDYTCNSCSAALVCTSCPAQRSLSGSSCVCVTAFYAVPNQPVCQPCSYKCVQCDTTSVNCLMCSAAALRTVIPACDCQIGTFDAGVSQCSLCDYRCITCTNAITCSSCSAANNRQLNANSAMCDCLPNFYDSNNNIACIACYYTCLTCNHPTLCLTCPANRVFLLGQCLCNTGFFDSGSLTCTVCPYSCYQCTQLSQCSACDATKQRYLNTNTRLCDCAVGYFDAGTQLCNVCDSSCATCINAVSCATCPLHTNKIILTGFCVCPVNQYENFTQVYNTTSICQACYYACATCTQPTFCATCASNAFRTLTAQQCVCNAGYFQVVNQVVCQACYSNCLSCFGTANNNCLTCAANTYFLNSICYATCPDYYRNKANVCEECPSNCRVCTSSAALCTTCTVTYFLFNYNASYVGCVQKCPDFYYEVSSKCFACIYPCLRCSSATSCLDCVPKFYPHANTCYPCQSSCLQCSGATAFNCSTCIQDYYLVNSLCTKLNCLSTEYVSSTQGCTPCSTSFANSLTCTAFLIQSCTQAYLLLNNTCVTCSLVKGYYLDTVSNLCADLCGDGIIITSLCDDGNTLNGDGCSSLCTIQSGWICPNNLCQIAHNVSLTVLSVHKTLLQNQIVILLALDIGLRLLTANFIMSFKTITKFNYTVIALNNFYNSYKIIINYFENAINDQLSLSIVSPIKNRLLYTVQQQSHSLIRVLQSTLLPLTISLSLQISIPMTTQPPLSYTSPSAYETYSVYLFSCLAIVHTIIVLSIGVTLFMQLKVMLLIIDSLHLITVLFIVVGFGLSGANELSAASARGLQPFIIALGESFSNMYGANNYTMVVLSCCWLQLLILGVVLVMRMCSDNPYWHYACVGLTFAFAYDLMLGCGSIFASSTFIQLPYDWAGAVLLCVLLFTNTSSYIFTAAPRSNKKIVPAVSFATNDHKPNVFDEEEESEQGTEMDTVVPEQDLFQLQPSEQSVLSERGVNHIPIHHLPIRGLVAPLAMVVGASISAGKIRVGILIASCFLLLLYLIIGRTQKMNTLRHITLILQHCIIMLIVVCVGVCWFAYSGVQMDAVIVTLLLLSMLLNAVTFIVSVKRSVAYREYLIEKKNKETLQRNQLMNKPHPRIYTQETPYKISSAKWKQEERGEQKGYEKAKDDSKDDSKDGSFFEKAMPRAYDKLLPKGKMHVSKDATTFLNLEQQSQQTESEKQYLDEKYRVLSTPYKRKKGEKKFINDLTIVQEKRKAQRRRESELIDMIGDGMSIHSNQEMHPQRIPAGKPLKTPQSKAQRRFQNKPQRISASKPNKDNELDVIDLGDDDQEMPSGVPNPNAKKQNMEFDQISSIKEEREQFYEQGMGHGSTQGMSVFKKILQDYKVYNVKKKKKNTKKK